MTIPKSLQPILWSVKIEDLNLKKDRVYIIHQILAFGSLEQLKWLLKNYSLKEVREVFIKYPLKIYRPQSFNFIKNFFVKIENKKLDEKKYIAPSL
jgi:hypothetical protein